jgi:hypothetical protein
MELTLNKANKLREKLRQVVDSHRDASLIKFNVGVKNPPPNMDGVRAKIGRAYVADQELNQLEFDQDALKEALFAANVSSGVSRKLTLLERLKRQLQRAERQLGNFQAYDAIEASALDDIVARNANSETTMQVIVSHVEKSTLEKQITEIRKVINKTEDEVAFLNASTVITIEFLEPTQRALGLA